MRRISTVLFDLDGTLVRYHGVEFESSWGALAAAAGVIEASRALLAEYFHRRDAYDEWVVKDAALLAGTRLDEVAPHLFPAPYAEGVRQAVARLQGNYRLGILSSGVGLVADWVCEDLGFDFARANWLEIREGEFTGRSETRVSLWEKGETLDALADELGFRLDEACYVGDHLNDIPAMERSALAIAANPKDERVAAVCDHTVTDLSVIPDLIDGFVRDERFD